MKLFFMVTGDMVVKTMEKGQPKDVVIREGEVCVMSHFHARDFRAAFADSALAPTASKHSRSGK